MTHPAQQFSDSAARALVAALSVRGVAAHITAGHGMAVVCVAGGPCLNVWCQPERWGSDGALVYRWPRDDGSGWNVRPVGWPELVVAAITSSVA